jgi:hypothetical protein
MKKIQNSNNIDYLVHSILKVSPEQEKQLNIIESEFSDKSRVYRKKMIEANHNLAIAIREDKFYSERVQRAVEEIHSPMAELQKVTIEHYFEMQKILNEEQSEKLNNYIVEKLLNTNHE